MKKLRRMQFKKGLLIMLMIILIVIGIKAITPKPARAGTWCDVALIFEGRSTMYNFLCFVEVVMDTFNDDYWGDI